MDLESKDTVLGKGTKIGTLSMKNLRNRNIILNKWIKKFETKIKDWAEDKLQGRNKNERTRN